MGNSKPVSNLEERVNKNKAYFEKYEIAFSRIEEYKGKFIAILDEKVVDYDLNESKLVGRIIKDYGSEAPFWIGNFTGRETHYMPSVYRTRE